MRYYEKWEFEFSLVSERIRQKHFSIDENTILYSLKVGEADIHSKPGNSNYKQAKSFWPVDLTSFI